MGAYVEIIISGAGPDPDALIAGMAQIGFEGFSEEEGMLRAYVPAESYDAEKVDAMLAQLPGDLAKEVVFLDDINYNALWESNFQPVTIAGRCLVRAPFHQKLPPAPLEIVIEPKMSFGTAHHETTALMMELLLENEPGNKNVLDMGTGTGILGILALKLGANSVMAIDNDRWAVENALENFSNNLSGGFEVVHGDANAMPPGPFDIVLANINRNVLINDIPAYVSVMTDNGLLYLSGFLNADEIAVKEAAAKSNLTFRRYKNRNGWSAMVFQLDKTNGPA